MTEPAERTHGVDLARSQRERHAHDQGIDRVGYNAVLRNSAAYYEGRREEIIGQTLARFNGGRFLELGSSSWRAWIEKTGVRPGSLTCINISQRELDKGIAASMLTRTKPEFLLMDANDLQFEDNSFDVVYGGGILHHLQFQRALDEVRRVLRPGGAMVFEEPLNINPVGKLVRALTPHARTEDERPLGNAELDWCARRFSMRSHYLQFLSVPVGVVTGLLKMGGQNAATRTAFAVDEWLVKKVPGIGRLYRHVVLIGYKPETAPA